jgi:hypothetical protein
LVLAISHGIYEEVKSKPSIASNASPDNAVVFAPDASRRDGINNGNTTILLFKKGSVVVCAVSGSALNKTAFWLPNCIVK